MKLFSKKGIISALVIVLIAGGLVGLVTYRSPVLNSDGTDSGYTKDFAHVYYDGDIVQGADPSTFTASKFVEEGGDDEYGKDKNHVYFFEFLIPNADAGTFTVFDSLQKC